MSRVLILTGIFPPDIGGPATSVPELAVLLIERGEDVVVVTLADEGVRRARDPCPVIRVPRRLSRVRRLSAIVRNALAVRPDIVLANGLHIESALLPRVPTVQKIVGDWAWERASNAGMTSLSVEAFQRAPLPLRLRALRATRSRVTKRARIVLVPSRYVGSLVQSWGVAGARLRVVPNAAPPVHEVAEVGERSGDRALFVGRLVRWKHVDDVLGVLPRMPGLHLDVVGSGPEQERLERLSVELGLHRRVQFLGVLRREEVLERMRQATFLVLPSSYEGMPHVVLEAFAQGLPVVASASGGTPELVADGVSGFLYRCGDLAGLERAMSRALVPAAAAAAASGGRVVARRLSAEASAQATLEVFTEALAER